MGDMFVASLVIVVVVGLSDCHSSLSFEHSERKLPMPSAIQSGPNPLKPTVAIW